MPDLSSMFTGPWAPLLWGLMAAVPLAIVALYFLKLKRQPVEVPSTYLWTKSIEDLHVNSIWQRLRQSLLLFLQLLLILLVIFALLRPSFSGMKTIDDRSIFLLDVSASMSGTDTKPSRLEEAKRQIAARIETMDSDDVAMIITFSNEATVVQPETGSQRELLRALERIQPTQRTTSFIEPLRIASGLANPQRQIGEISTAETASPADLYIYSDGNFQAPSFTLGYLTPEYIPLGAGDVANVAIAAFSARRNEDRPDELQAFASLENHGPEDAVVRAELYLGTVLQDVKDVEVPAGDSNGVVFQLANVPSGVLRLELKHEDALALDNVAWVTINEPRRSKVLLVTPGNEPLLLGLQAEGAQKLIDLAVEEPPYLESDQYAQAALGGLFDMIIYDRCVPPDNEEDEDPQTPMPQSNTMFIGAVPKLAAWGFDPGKSWPPPKADVPRVIDVNRAHPLMQLVELGDVIIAEGVPLKPPPGGDVLLDTVAYRDEQSIQAAMIAIGPREGYEDLILGFNIMAEDRAPDTNWALRYSFPVFVLNTLKYLGGGLAAQESQTFRPGERVELRLDTPEEKVTVATPSGERFEITRGGQNTFNFIQTGRVGVYEVSDSKGLASRFAVNLFDSRESNLKPTPTIDLDWDKIEGTQTVQPARQETWKIILLLALAVLIFEWYIYNRRVYL